MMATVRELPPPIEYTLEQMRLTITAQPEYLLETFGGPSSHGEHVFADIYGLDDELVDTIRLCRAEPVILMPIRQRLTPASLDEPPTPHLRVARYERLSSYATANVSVEYAPGWEYDMQTFQVRLLLVRYRRRL